jgi:hypothetical protein
MKISTRRSKKFSSFDKKFRFCHEPPSTPAKSAAQPNETREILQLSRLLSRHLTLTAINCLPRIVREKGNFPIAAKQ